MDPLKICILGAGGSIGSRLVAKFHADGAQVIAVVRTLSSAIRIGRLDIQIEQLDLLKSSPAELASVLEGVDVVIDCTYSTNENYDECLNEAKALAELICHASKDAGVGRIIHYGTISVYPKGIDIVDESVECEPCGDRYADSKLASEVVFLGNSTDGLPITVLQLPIVYGPYMGWSISPVTQMKGHALVLYEDFAGACSPLYVDDVYHATKLAFNCEQSFGGRFLISDTSISWLSYYKLYSKMSPDLKLKVISKESFHRQLLIKSNSEKPYQQLKSRFSIDGEFRQLVLSQVGIRTVYKLFKWLRGQEGMDKLKSSIEASLPRDESQSEIFLPEQLVEVFENLPKVNSSKAGLMLGLEAYTPIDVGINETMGWLKWARLVD